MEERAPPAMEVAPPTEDVLDAAPPALELATPSAPPSRQVLPAALVAHVACASLVQVSDYASDLLVAYTLVRSGDKLAELARMAIFWSACFSASVPKILCSPIGDLFGAWAKSESRWYHRMLLFLLAPLNLHIA